MLDIQMTLMLLNIVQNQENVCWNNVLQKVDKDYLKVFRILFFKQKVWITQRIIVISIYLKCIFTTQNQPFLIKFNFRTESSETPLTEL